MPEEDIKQLTLAAIDVVLQEYDETIAVEVR